MAFSCEGYKASASPPGIISPTTECSKHHRPGRQARRGGVQHEHPRRYNIGGDAWEIDTVLRKCGIHITSTLSGDVSYDQVKKSHTVMLNGVMCHRSIQLHRGDDGEEIRHSVDQDQFHRRGSDGKNNFARSRNSSTAKSSTDRVEEVIAPGNDCVATVARGRSRPASGQKSRAVCRRFGGRIDYQDLFRDIRHGKSFPPAMSLLTETITKAESPATIKVDADSRNIEELHVEPDPARFNTSKTPEQIEALKAGGFSFKRLRRHDGRDEEKHARH